MRRGEDRVTRHAGLEIALPRQPGDGGAHPVSQAKLPLGVRAAREHMTDGALVIVDPVGEGAHHHQSLRLLGEQREGAAELQTGDGGRRRAGDAAVRLGRFSVG